MKSINSLMVQIKKGRKQFIFDLNVLQFHTHNICYTCVMLQYSYLHGRPCMVKYFLSPTKVCNSQVQHYKHFEFQPFSYYFIIYFFISFPLSFNDHVGNSTAQYNMFMQILFPSTLLSLQLYILSFWMNRKY